MIMVDSSLKQNLYRGTLQVEGFGTLRLAWSERGLVSLDWEESKRVSKGAAREDELARKHQHNSEAALESDQCQVPERYRTLLLKYFRGEAVDPANLPVDLRGTEFQVKVWELLRRIPRGSVCSYSEIAELAGSPQGARAVGSANRSNQLPIVVPCHRVVRTGLRLGGYSGGLKRKRLLLRLEGVRVVSDRVEPALIRPLGV